MVKSNKCEKCMYYSICKNTKTYKEKIEELLKINNTVIILLYRLIVNISDLPKMSIR